MPFRLSLDRHFCSTADARNSSVDAGALLGDELESAVTPSGIFSSPVSDLDLG